MRSETQGRGRSSALLLAIACVVVVAVTACTRAEDKPLPTDPKARADVDAQSPKLTEESRRFQPLLPASRCRRRQEARAHGLVARRSNCARI
jgi:hypothetical protein